jgi:hypothetical protein
VPFQDHAKNFFPYLDRLMPGRKYAGEVARPPVVAIFGKHPGWSDHITLPLPTPGLRGLWQMIYTTGIRTIIERGTWSQLSDHELIPFGHLFLTGQKRSWIAGRMWASADKVGRRDYPMMACVDFEDASIDDALNTADPILRKLEAVCRATTQPAEVLSALETARTQAAAVAAPAAAAVPPLIQALASHSDLKEIQHPLLRVLWPWAQLLNSRLDQKIFSRRTITGTPPVRVPLCAESGTEAIKLWARFTAEIAGPGYPVFLASPDGCPWVDILLGKPDPSDLAVLRRSIASFELITQLPEQVYTKAFQKWAAAKLG